MRRFSTIVLVVLLAACSGGEEPEVTAETGSGDGSTTAPDGISIAYSASGEGPIALVFVHCWACDRGYWKEQIEPFSASHRVVTVDLPGHGDSGMGREGWPLTAYKDDVVAVVDELGLERVILVGHSMGGPVAVEAAPLLGDRLLGVICVDALHNADFEWPPGAYDAYIRGYEEDYEGTCDTFVRQMFPGTADPALVDEIAGDMCSGSPEVGLALQRQFIDWDMAGAMSASGTRIRCINAAAFPTDVEANRNYADYNAVIMEGVGHFPMRENPEEFNRLLADLIEELTGA